MCCINAVLALERRPNNAYMHWPFRPAAALQLDILSFCASFKLDPEAFVYVAVCFVCTSPACVGVTNMILYFQGLQCQHRWMAVTKVRCLLDTWGRYCILFFHNFPLQRLQPRHCFLTHNFFTQPKTMKNVLLTFYCRTPPFSLSLFWVEIWGKWIGNATEDWALIRSHCLHQRLTHEQLVPSTMCSDQNCLPPATRFETIVQQKFQVSFISQTQGF